MKTTTGIALGFSGLLLGLTINVATPNEASLPHFNFTTHILVSTSSTAEKLHRMKLKQYVSVEKSMEETITANAKTLAGSLSNKSMSEYDASKIYRVLRLLSVMNEKYTIEEWRSNTELNEIFNMAQKNDPKHTAQLRCFNWSKPMWVDKKGCS